MIFEEIQRIEIIARKFSKSKIRISKKIKR